MADIKLIYQKSQFCTAKGIYSGELLAEATVLGTEIEATGRLRADRVSFEIKDARWEVFRSPAGSLNGSGEAPGLIGIPAYLDAGRELRRIVGEQAGGVARELLAECVRGVIQAETFIFQERGFPTAAAYDDYWDEFNLNGCRYYSNLQRTTRRFNEHVAEQNHGLNLFNRFKNCSVYRLEDGLIAYGGFSDSFHELGLSYNLDLEGRIVDSSGSFLRAPDQVCFENALHPGNLKGVNLTECTKKQLAQVLGGPQGCQHLVDIADDLRKASVYVLKNICMTVPYKA